MSEQPTLFDTLPNNEDTLTLADFAERAYLDYAISVVKGRALADVCDGQKPVQRRILYAMNELGLNAQAKPRKSAAVVGDVLGKLHPHGDQSVYDALVRMAQNFSLRYPLIDGQGNFGSRDGDNAAAMRYTEARLTPIATLLQDEIDMGTVDFQPNYDGSTQEPKLLPARLPFILLNGVSGIAVGLATEIPSHNLNEIACALTTLIQNPKLSHDALMEIIPGPDFPGGGHIISAPEVLSEMYRAGRGSMKVRASWKVEDMARGQWQIVITELPPGTSSQKILEEIEELTNPKIRLGKKALSQEQINLKQSILSILDSVRDESGRDAPVRLVLEPKSRTQDQNTFIQTLLAHTSLETNTSLNLVMIGSDGKPAQKSLLDILREWIGFRFATVIRRTQYRLEKINDRIHILEGRETVLLHIDKVIHIIRESDEPKPALIKTFKLSDRQAEDILEIRLRQLARLETIKIQQELKNLREEKTELQHLLDNPNALKKCITKEIEADAKKFGDTRRTRIEVAQRAVAEQKIIDEPITVIVSQKGWVRARNGHGHDRTQFNFKAGDSLYAAFECRTTDSLLAFGSNGRIYSVAITSLPNARGDSIPMNTFIELTPGSRIVHYFAGAAETTLLLANNRGYGFTAQISDMMSRNKAGKAFMTIDENSIPIIPTIVHPNDSAIACLSEQGRLLIFSYDEIKHLSGGGRGVILMGLDNQESLLTSCSINQSGLVLQGIGRAGKEQTISLNATLLTPYIGKRARKGKRLEQKIKPSTIYPSRSDN